MEGYLLDRLQGLAKSSWLDEFPFFAAVHVTELIGAVAAFGTRVNFDILNEDQRYEARHAGAKLAHPSPDELLKLMDNLMKEHLSKDTGSTKSPAAIFGKLYTTPAQGLPDPAFDPLRTVMGAFILKRFALGPGDRLFGQPVTERRLHSIRSASLEYKLHPKRLRKILLAEGLISTPKGRDRDVDFAVQHAERIFRREHDSLAMHEVARYLSATRAQTEALLSAGVLKRHKAVGGMKEYVLRPELDHFLSRLLSRAVAVKVKPDRAVGIAEARRCARCTTVEIVRGILDGKLAWVGSLAGFEGLASVLLDIKQVKAATKLGDMPGLTPAVVGREILKTHSIKQLIRSGIIKTVDAVNPLNRHPTKIIEFAEIERFRKEYVSLYLLAQAQGQCMATFKKALRAKGISPVAFDGVEATFYRRADVELMIAPKPSTRGSTAYDTIK
ncbi:hypothetical protein XI09_33305 [Bradyrhizobium sp. CCBAU 11386]|nr:hypothetical protein [Bradyrhizobium sp. CCBAU 11386]